MDDIKNVSVYTACLKSEVDSLLKHAVNVLVLSERRSMFIFPPNEEELKSEMRQLNQYPDVSHEFTPTELLISMLDFYKKVGNVKENINDVAAYDFFDHAQSVWHQLTPEMQHNVAILSFVVTENEKSLNT